MENNALFKEIKQIVMIIFSQVDITPTTFKLCSSSVFQVLAPRLGIEITLYGPFHLGANLTNDLCFVFLDYLAQNLFSYFESPVIQFRLIVSSYSKMIFCQIHYIYVSFFKRSRFKCNYSLLSTYDSRLKFLNLKAKFQMVS